MIVAVIQARCSSSRLPNKVLKDLAGAPVIVRLIERLKLTHNIDEIILATSTSPSDDPLETICKDHNIKFYRGDLNNVLKRFYNACAKYKPNHIVRITGDCPVIDPQVVDECIELHLKLESDYTANCLQPSFPDGLDVEVMTFASLEQSYKKASKPSELEHVTLYIRNPANKFKIHELKSKVDLSMHRWTVDEPEDYELISKIYNYLYESNNYFNTEDILNLLIEKPELTKINSHYTRNEGLIKSLKKDKDNGYE